MGQSLDEIYTAEWVAHDFADLQSEFDIVAASLVRQFNLRDKTVADVGCGPGLLIRGLFERGVHPFGFEGSKPVIDYARLFIRDRIEHVDVTKLEDLICGPELRRPNLIVCTEVAEHLDEKDADGLVKLLCSALCPIVFTAAPPGQDGHHHVNCQERGYWIGKFERHGALYDEDATTRLRARWFRGLKRLSHMIGNVMVFT